MIYLIKMKGHFIIPFLDHGIPMFSEPVPQLPTGLPHIYITFHIFYVVLGLEAVEEGGQFVVPGMFRSIVLACFNTMHPKVKGGQPAVLGIFKTIGKVKEEKLVLGIFKTIVLSCLQTRILKPTSLVYLC